MTTPLLTTKLYIPPVRPRERVVPRPRLIKQLNEGLHRKLTLISAPAGFGKTTLVSEWIAGCERPAAWLSLDEGDNDVTRFLAYLIAALQTIAARQSSVGNIGEGVLGVLQSPQPPATESILTALINDITAIPDSFVLVLDDYHVIDAKPIHKALTFALEHLPPQMHLIIATREDPHLPLARLRARGQLTELRATDLRFTSSEAAAFLNQVMGLDLSAEDVAALERRTEGWIAGLQLAAISMQGRKDVTGFIQSFTGSHHFVLDYLIQEVLGQQPESVQAFLLRTSILDRLCGPLCDAVCSAGTASSFKGTAVLHGDAGLPPTPAASGQETLEYLERANLFIVPLDNERRWYRYHHLFADLLRQRLQQKPPPPVSPPPGGMKGGEEGGIAELHIRASVWFEENGLEIEAFHHAAAANDVERAARLMEGDGMPLPFRGAVAPVLNWLASLPATVLDARPLLWVTYASTLLATGQRTGVERKLRAAEAALESAEPVPSAVEGPDDKTRDLIGRIAATRATLAVGQNRAETIIAQSRRALEYLHPDNLAFRTSTTWKLGYAFQLQGDRAAAKQAYTEAMSIGQVSGNIIFTATAIIGLGSLQEAENQLYLAAESYRHALQLFGDHPLPAIACEAYLGLARIYYEWNDLDAAQQNAQKSIQQVRRTESNDTSAACEVLLARLKLAQGDVTGADATLARADQLAHQHNFVHRRPEVAAAQVLALLHQGDLAGAAHLAQTHELPISQARVSLAQGDTGEALASLEPLRQQMEAKGWQDERLKIMVLQAVALHAAALRAGGEEDEAVQLLHDALALAEPGGFIRTFVDEGTPMAQLLYEAATRGIMPNYTRKLLAAFEAEERKSEDKPHLPPAPPAQPLIEPLSQRELEVLQLIAEGLTNPEIAARLYLSLNTVKVHTRNIYGKLNVHSRVQAIARSQELGLLPRT